MDTLLKYTSYVLVTFIFFRILYSFICILSPKIQENTLSWNLPLNNVSPPALFHYLNNQFTRFRNHPFVYISSVFIANRIIIAIIATLAFSFLEGKPISVLDNFDAIWLKWDSRHYLHIAEFGYPTSGDQRAIIAFYPMYPALIRLAATIVNDYFLAAIIVSSVCLWMSCIMLYRLMNFEFGNDESSKNSVKYLLLFPLSYFGSMAYAESTFLLFSICSFYYMRRGMWFWAGMFGLFAALTRTQGILLFGPMVYELIRQNLEQLRKGQAISKTMLISRACTALLIPLGIGLYLGVNKYVHDDWFAFLFFQKQNWGQEFMLFSDNIVNIANRIDDGNWPMAIGTWLPSITVFIFCLVIITISTSILPNAYTIYSLAFLIISYSPSWLLSGARYMFVLFPIYMVLAKVLHKRKAISHHIDMALTCFLVLILFAFIKYNVY
ncbi:MAG: hypothetical protein COA42_07365 [Alteromonadaceae bacterium]|nr:MAG: hypothetical protein COA42_07365 [Alteromonadaceae bacterium]